MMTEKAAINWTVGRLLTFILLIIVLVLIIWGVGNGLGDLVSKLGAAADSVLVTLHLKDDGFSDDACWSDRVSEWDKGNVLLDNLALEGVERNKLELRVCKDATCVINGSKEIKPYRIVKFRFQVYEGGNWKPYEYFLKGNLDGFKEDLERLDVDSLREKYGAGTGKFVLTTHSNLRTAVWSEGEWVVKDEEKIVYSGSDDEEALETYREIVDHWYGDDFVYYGFDIATETDYSSVIKVENSIGNLVGDSWGNNQLDSNEDMKNLKVEFVKIKKMLIDETKFSKEDFEEAYEATRIHEFLLTKCG